MLSDLLKD